MDANGTRFHLLLGEADWQRCRSAAGGPPFAAGTGLAWNGDAKVITLRPQVGVFVAGRGDRPVPLKDRRGNAGDRYGNLYWIDSTETKILVQSAATRETGVFWEPGPEGGQEVTAGEFQPQPKPAPLALPLSGLAVTEDHLLVVGVRAPAGLLVFDLHGAGSRQQILWPPGALFRPFDLSARAGGGVWVLDRDHRRVWELDRQFRVLKRTPAEPAAHPGDFQPTPPPAEPADETHPPVGTEDAWPVVAGDPVAIEGLPDGSVLVLDRGSGSGLAYPLVHRLRRTDATVQSTQGLEDVLTPEARPGFALRAHDLVFLPDQDSPGSPAQGTLFIVGTEGNQAFAFRLVAMPDQFTLSPSARFYPLRLYGGRGLCVGAGRAWYDLEQSWSPLVHQPRARFAEEAVLITPRLDGREPECVWHRLLLDAAVPPGTTLRIQSRTAETEAELLDPLRWQDGYRDEPPPYRRAGGPELPLVRAGGEAYGTWELLFQQARGRYLQLRVTLRGDSLHAPEVRALRAWYPRFSYLHEYLPALYRDADRSPRQNPPDRSVPTPRFLERWLANFEGVFTSIEDRIAAVQGWLDARSAPPEALDWLGSWLGLAFDPSWSEPRRRLLLRHTREFYQARGTVRGLRLALRLALDECPDESIFAEEQPDDHRRERYRIVELFLTRRASPVALGDPTSRASEAPASARRWQPPDGAAALHARWRQFLADNALAGAGSALTRFPVLEPEASAPDDPLPARWRQFAEAALGFVPSAEETDLRAWQRFLASRYASLFVLNQSHVSQWTSLAQVPLPDPLPLTGRVREDWNDFILATTGRAGRRRRLWHEFLAHRWQRIERLNLAYGAAFPGFADVPPPTVLPTRDDALRDWHDFESTVLGRQRAAHKFLVLLAVPARTTLTDEALQQRLARARRVVELEKPAHTVFDVRPFWDLFRADYARLGPDTVLGPGSRAPELIAPFALDHGYLGTDFLASRHPEDRTGRHLVDFNPL